jgi:uncharacterized protein (TIGR00255 family)
MIKSMTGYGKASCETGGKKITVEIKSWNSKQFDINLKMPGSYREKEAELRSQLAAVIIRGKVDLYVNIENSSETTPFVINKGVAMQYYRDLLSLKEEINQKTEPDYVSMLLRLPDVVKSGTDEVGEDEWKTLLQAISDATEKFDAFRINEGAILENDVRKRIGLINDYFKQVASYEQARIGTIRDRITKNLAAFAESNTMDKNRYEQELIYYLERIDFTEEKVRLKKHLDYFLDTLADPEPPGRKLAFVTQEIGREINTLGSKANDADIQKLVVQMKDELEKIKEQSMNVL